jgi:hypothetical protein
MKTIEDLQVEFGWSLGIAIFSFTVLLIIVYLFVIKKIHLP